MSDTTIDSTFNFDPVPQESQTLTDEQPSDGSDRYADEPDVVDITPKVKTVCLATFSRMGSWDKDDKGGEVLNFIVAEGDHAGFEAGAWLTLKGPQTAVAQGKRNLAAWCKAFDLPTEGRLGDLVKALRGKVHEEIRVELKPGASGCFVNPVTSRK